MPLRLVPPVSRALRVAAVAVVMTAVVVPPGAASADQQSSVQAQISALRDQLGAIGRQVHDLTFTYTADQVNLASLSQQLQVDQARVQQATAAVARTGDVLRQEVLGAYVGGFTEPPGPGRGGVAGTTGGGVADPAVRYGYISIATSGVQESLDSYRAARLQLNSALAAVADEQDAARTAAASADRARQVALSEASQAGARLVSLETQLSTLEQQAAAARAAAQARAAAESRAHAPVQTQGGPVNGGLVAVVRARVDPPAPAAPAPAVPPTVPTSTPAPTSPPTTAAPPPTTAAPAPPPPPSASSPSQPSADVWLELRTCESGNDYQANTGNGYFGAYQFSQQTWTDLGYPGRPDLEPPAMQDQAAQQLQAQSGWGQWPACAAALGLT